MPATSSPQRNPLLLVGVGLGVALLLALLVALITHRSAAPPRSSHPAVAAPPAAHGPFAPVYGGGAPMGRRRGGF